MTRTPEPRKILQEMEEVSRKQGDDKKNADIQSASSQSRPSSPPQQEVNKEMTLIVSRQRHMHAQTCTMKKNTYVECGSSLIHVPFFLSSSSFLSLLLLLFFLCFFFFSFFSFFFPFLPSSSSLLLYFFSLLLSFLSLFFSPLLLFFFFSSSSSSLFFFFFFFSLSQLFTFLPFGSGSGR